MGWSRDRQYRFGEGVCRVYAQNDPKFPDGALWELSNCVYDLESENPEAMRGSTQVGTTAMADVVSGLFDYKEGTKLLASAENGLFYEYAGSDWAAGTGARATGNSATDGVRWNGTMFYSATDADSIMCLGNGVDAPAKYDGTDFKALGGSLSATANFPVAWQNRVWWASGSTLLGSATNDCENYTASAGGININVYRGTGDITGLAAFARHLFIFKRHAIFVIAPTATFNDLNVENVSLSVGCTSHRSIDDTETGTSLIFKSERGLDAIVPGGGSSGFSVANISRFVRPILDRTNPAQDGVSWGLFNLKRLEYYYTYATGTQTVPKEGLIANVSRQSKPYRWTQWAQPNLTAGTIYRESGTGYKQVVGDTSGKVFLMNVNSATDFSGVPINTRIQTKYYVGNYPENMKVYNWVFVDARSEGTYPISVNLSLLRYNMPIAPLSNKADLTRIGADDGWGVGTYGVALWGGSGITGERMRPQGGRRGAALKIIVTSSRWFRLNGFVAESEPRKSTLVA